MRPPSADGNTQTRPNNTGPLFSKRTDVLPQDLVNSRREI